MASGLGTLTVWLTANNDGLKKGFADSQQETTKWKSSMQGAMAGVAAGVGAIGIGAFVKSSIDAYKENESAVSALEAALAAAGDNVDKFSSRYQKFSENVMAKTVFDHDKILEIMAYGKQMGIAADQLEDAAAAAVGLASKYNIDLSTSMGLIAKANLGATDRLKRYGIVLDESMSKEEKFAALLKIGGDSFVLAEAKTKTYAGTLAQLGNSYAEIKEETGKLVVEGLGLTSMFKDVSNACMGVSQYIGGLDDATKNVIARTGFLAMGVAALTGAYKALMMTGIVQGIAGLTKYAFACATTTTATTLNTSALWKEVQAQNALNISRALSLKNAGMGTMGAGIQTIGKVSGTGVVTLAAETAVATKTTLGLGAALKTMGAWSFATSSAMAALGTAVAIPSTAFAGWKIGDWISEITGLKDVLTDFYGTHLFGMDQIQKKSDELDEKRKALPALGARGIMAGEEAAKAKEEADRKYKEAMLKPSKFDPAAAMEERKFQDQVIIANMANATVEDKLKVIAFERNAILRESMNVINSTGDAEKDKKAEEERLLALRKEDFNLQKKKSEILKEEAEKTKAAAGNFEQQRKAMIFDAMTNEEKINDLYRQRAQLIKDIEGAKGADQWDKKTQMLDVEKQLGTLQDKQDSGAAPKTESSVIAAVQRGSAEALRIENTSTSKDSTKITENTGRTAKGVEKLLQVIGNIKPAAGVEMQVAV